MLRRPDDAHATLPRPTSLSCLSYIPLFFRFVFMDLGVGAAKPLVIPMWYSHIHAGRLNYEQITPREFYYDSI